MLKIDNVLSNRANRCWGASALLYDKKFTRKDTCCVDIPLNTVCYCTSAICIAQFCVFRIFTHKTQTVCAALEVTIVNSFI